MQTGEVTLRGTEHLNQDEVDQINIPPITPEHLINSRFHTALPHSHPTWILTEHIFLQSS